MKCAEAQGYFDEMYREGEDFSRPDVVKHLKTCDTCSHLYARWRQIAQELSTPAAVPPPSADFTQKILASIESRRPRIVMFPFYSQRLAWAALLLITVCGFLAVQWYRMKTDRLIHGKTAAAETVHFEYTTGDAATVALVGDFNGWDTQRHLLRKKDGRTWSIDLPIPRGDYLYLFLVDGKKWRTDPLRGTLVPDGFGGYNSEINL